jgi:hypothetical protein
MRQRSRGEGLALPSRRAAPKVRWMKRRIAVQQRWPRAKVTRVVHHNVIIIAPGELPWSAADAARQRARLRSSPFPRKIDVTECEK